MSRVASTVSASTPAGLRLSTTSEASIAPPKPAQTLPPHLRIEPPDYETVLQASKVGKHVGRSVLALTSQLP